ncbi:CDP-alcohol phosphatidyltransferase family protein [Pseudonocardia sp. CA-107938]|uniref:CDP-alcohol phosphatidyltransferase family protein n=1 Tax=Pseudonocardia sp. CA-107938 TaxID=3240021 RepID=UPI003D8A1272
MASLGSFLRSGGRGLPVRPHRVAGPTPATWQLAVAAAGAVVLLVAIGSGPVGWAAGLAYLAALLAVLAWAVRRAGATTLGPADLVTLLRAVLIVGVTALVADGLATGATPVAVLVTLSSVALVLDAVDGKVARRTETVTPLGARFDMEIDAVLLLVLSVHVAVLLGPWVLAIGLIRYVFVAVSLALPWLGATLTARYAAKVVAALQGIVLVVAASELLPTLLAVIMVAVALALLVWSFAVDIPRLWQMAHPGPTP